MTKEEIIEKFKDTLNKEQFSFIIPSTFGGVTGQGINFDIRNSIPDKATRTYLKVDSLREAKEIWTEVLSDLPKEKEVGKVFDKFIPSDLDLTQDLFLSIYSGKK